MLRILTKSVGKANALVAKNTASKTLAVVTVHKANYGTIGEYIQYFKYKYFPQPREHLDEDKWAKIFCFEGNIGAGKSKLAKAFAEKLNLKYFKQATSNYDLERRFGLEALSDEVLQWDLDPRSAVQAGRNFSMETFYKNPKDWVYTGRFQQHMMACRYFQYNDAMAHLLGAGNGVVMVQHYYSDVVYAEAMRQLGWMTKDVFEWYDTYHFYADDDMIAPQVVLYLDIPAERCFEKLQAGSKVEKMIPLEYLKAIENAYKHKYLPSARDRGVNVIELDSEEIENVDMLIQNLDDLDTMLAPNNWWGCSNKTLIDYYNKCTDPLIHKSKLTMYNPFEEMWSPLWYNDAKFMENLYQKGTYEKGFNKDLGDKWIWLRS